MVLSIKTMKRILLSVTGLLLSHPVLAEYGVNFPEPASDIAQEIYDIHMLTMQISTFLFLIVVSVVLYSVVMHRKSRGVQPDLEFHKSAFGRWSWAIVPVLVFGIDLAIAGNADKALKAIWTVPDDPDLLEVRVTGHQWWWEFDYIDYDIKVESRFLPEEQAGEHYLRDVDNRLVLPVDTKIRFLHTSADVIHAFWVPQLGFKRDAIPGYITESWTELNREGLFRGQCAEICGTWHSRMPTVVEAVSKESFAEWVAEQRAEQRAELALATSDKVWALEELMERGKSQFETICAVCHQVNGMGLPPAFPPLVGSATLTGPVEDHIKTVLNGRPGTAMPPWNALSDLDIAAVVTYERNAWGQNSGDVVQPADVKNLR